MNRYCLLLLFCCFAVFSQNLHQRFDGIPVNIGGSLSNSPFSGGIDIPRYQLIDIDYDNDLDIFIFDRDTNLNFYRNDGNASAANFVLISNKYFSLSFKNWFYFTDIDNDNDRDLFCGGDSQHVRYIKNTGSASNPVYQIQTYSVKTDLNQDMLSEGPCVPVFVDIDADGDIDFITGSSSGRLTFYENIGGPNNFIFKFITAFWKNLEIIGGADYIDSRLRGNDRKGNLEIIGGAFNLHGASSIYFEDIDGDNDRDLFWGDLFNQSLYFIRNTGSAQNFNYSVIDSTYPIPNAWFSGGFNIPRIHDIDNDGKKDLFIGVIIGSSPKNNFVYYRNTGTVNNPQFTKITDNYIKAIDAGSSSFPCFADIDNDNDFDLFIGGDKPYVSFFRNSGTAANPQFNLEIDSLPMLYSNFNFSVTIADLDNDSKKDMICGAFDGKLRYYRNTGTIQNPVFTFTASQLDAFDVGQSSAPVLADPDNDGDKDLLVGNSDGRLYYYINNGNPNVFNFSLVTGNYQSIFVGNDSAPSLGDIDNDGDPDLLIGNRLGVIYYYRNDGSVSNPNFVFVSNNYAGINVFYTAAPAIVDINADSDKDLFAGNIKGGLYYYENWDVFGIKQISSEVPEGFKLYQNYPNPFNPVTKIKFNIPSLIRRGAGVVVLKVYDILGREVTTLVNKKLQPGTYEAEWPARTGGDASNYPSGVYFYQLTVNSEQKIMFSETKRMVLVK